MASPEFQNDLLEELTYSLDENEIESETFKVFILKW